MDYRSFLSVCATQPPVACESSTFPFVLMDFVSIERSILDAS